MLQKEQLEQKHLHLLQVVESEKTAKWQYTKHCQDLTVEIKKLREEVSWARPGLPVRQTNKNNIAAGHFEERWETSATETSAF